MFLSFYRNKSQFFILLIFFFLACSAERNTAVSRFYHNTTAYYNPIFIIKKDHKKVVKNLWNEKELNFTKILPLYANYDSTKVESDREILENDIKLCSKAIDWHQNSKWVDDGYVKLGLTFFYLRKFEKAASSFKIAFRKSEDPNIKALALIHAIHSYTDNKQYKKAEDAINLLEKEGQLTPNNQKLFLLKKALYYQRIDDKKNMLKTLVELDSYKWMKLKKRDRKSYIYFIIAQLSEYFGDMPLASHYYKKTIKSNPTYLLDFHAKIRFYQVSKDVKQKSVEKMEKRFKKMLNDDKNKEFKDNIYYEWGLFKNKFSTPKEAAFILKKGLEVDSSSPLQRALIFLKLGEIYYENLENYTLASQYYDSTITKLPKDYENYEAIENKSKILKEFAKAYNTIKENDSLLYLATYDKGKLNTILNLVADSLILNKKRLKKLARKKRNAYKSSISGSYDKESDSYFSSANTNAISALFYFYNPELVSRGEEEFLQRWGDRALKDNWRRGNSLEIDTSQDQENQEVTADTNAEKKDSIKKPKPKKKANNKELSKEEMVDKMLSKIPFSEEQKKTIENKIDGGLLNISKIYAYKLEEVPKAIISLKRKIDRFEDSETRAEALYLLYLLYQEKTITNSDAADVKAYLIKRYPESIYAKLALNPSYREDKALQNENARKEYERIYALFKAKKYKTVKKEIEQAKVTYSQSDYVDNFDLLKALIIPEIGTESEYVTFLKLFPKLHPESELLTYVKSLEEHKKIYEDDMNKALLGIYSRKIDTSHYFVNTFPKNTFNPDSIAMKTNQFIKRQFPSRPELQANTTNLGNLNMIKVKGLKDKSDARIFYRSINTNSPYEEEKKHKHFDLFDLFVITDENLKILEEEKEVTEYLDFFEDYYYEFIVSQDKNN